MTTTSIPAVLINLSNITAALYNQNNLSTIAGHNSPVFNATFIQSTSISPVTSPSITINSDGPTSQNVDIDSEQHPGWQIGEAVFLATLVTAIIIGLPLNVYALCNLVKAYRRNKKPLILLHISLNLSDICVLLIYCVGNAVWHLTFAWPWGTTLCKFARHADWLALTWSSNAIVCIAADRLLAFQNPLKHRRISEGLGRGMIAMAVMAAAVTGIPQLYIWRATLFELPDDQSLTQCIAVWVECAYFGTECFLPQWTMTSYEVYHLIVTFWVPFLLSTICYVGLVRTMMNLAKQRTSGPNKTSVDNGHSNDDPSSHRDGTLRGSMRRTYDMAARKLLRGGQARSNTLQTSKSMQQSFVLTENKFAVDRPILEDEQDVGKTDKYGEINSGKRGRVVSSYRGKKGNQSAPHTPNGRRATLSPTFYKNGRPQAPQNENGCCTRDSNSAISPSRSNASFRGTLRFSGTDQMHTAKANSLRQAIALVTVYFITWLPYNVLAILVKLQQKSTILDNWQTALSGFIVVNAVLNPFIYDGSILKWGKCTAQSTRTTGTVNFGTDSSRRNANCHQEKSTTSGAKRDTCDRVRLGNIIGNDLRVPIVLLNEKQEVVSET